MAERLPISKGILATIAGAILLFWPTRISIDPPVPHRAPTPPKVTEVVIPLPAGPPRRRWHSRHEIKTWLANYRGRVFRTTQLPRCEHVEMILTYRPAPGETCAEVKRRTGAIVVSSGSYHHPKSMALADFLERDGRVLMARRTRRGILTSDNGQVADILDVIVRGQGTNALALGSRLVPFALDGFTRKFANQQTDRMAIGLTKGYVFVVQGVSDLWHLSDFMENGLRCTKAINADGGHVVKGRGPVHIAFRWRRKRGGEGAVDQKKRTLQRTLIGRKGKS